MKLIFKTLLPELNLKQDETFISDINIEICQKLISEFFKAIKLRYNPSYEQLKS